MFLVCARLYDFHLTGTREVFFLFLIFMFGKLLVGFLGFFVFFNEADVQSVLGAETERLL